jgi:hypothetical protein
MIIAGILIIYCWFTILIIIRRLHLLTLIGDRSQAECGKNYMEIETARNKIYTDYNKRIDKSLKRIKLLLGIILSLCLLSFTIVLAQQFFQIKSLRSQSLKPPGIREYLVVRVPIILTICIITYIVYIIQTYSSKLQNRYGNSVSKISIPMNTAVTGAFFFFLLFLASYVIWLNGYLLNRSSTAYIWILMILPATMIFAFVINLYVAKIQNEFIKPYSNTVSDINKNVNVLRNIDCDGCVIPDGAKKGMKVKDWMNLMLARNIKRMNPDEENGDPALLLADSTNSNASEYLQNLYAYIEHALGKELSELPDNVDSVNQARLNIRKDMRSLRHNNKAMLKPVKSLVRLIFMSTLLIILILTFIVYHSYYLKYPTGTTITTALISFLIIFILVAYSWYMGSMRYK